MIDFNKYLEKIKSIDKKKFFITILLGTILFVLVWAFVSASIMTKNFNSSQIQNKQDEQKVDAKGIIITETKDGQKYFEIYGETGSYTNELNIATLNNVVGNFYKNGEIVMSFQSSKGSYDEKMGTITLYKNSYIVLQDLTSLETDKLTWSGSENDIVAEGNVKIKKSNEMVALANKCVISPTYDKFKIIGKTSTKIYEKNSKK